jgi:8-oxo-dGTP pyrophosphatase MutT (NUDIX family)
MMVDTAELGRAGPFCACVILLDEDRPVLTLNADALPDGLADSAIRLGGVGGGQEPGESPWECAEREALEEVGAHVRLHTAPATYFAEAGEARAVGCAAGVGLRDGTTVRLGADRRPLDGGTDLGRTHTASPEEDFCQAVAGLRPLAGGAHNDLRLARLLETAAAAAAAGTTLPCTLEPRYPDQ